MECIAKGIYKMQIGEIEEITPVSLYKNNMKQKNINMIPISKEKNIKKEDIYWKQTRRGIQIQLPIDGEEDIYGFGLQLYSLNQTGLRRMIKVNSDPPTDTGESHAPIPFYISTFGYGMLVDTYRNVEFHMGTNSSRGSSSEMISENEEHEEFSEEVLYSLRRFSDKRKILIDIPSVSGVDIYFFEGNLKEIVQRYNMFSGGGCIPPMWGLGIWYRAYGGSDQEEIYSLVEKFEKDEMPLSVLGLEPGWQSHTYSCSYKWSDLFPDSKKLVKELYEKGVRVNLWEHAFVYPTAPFYKEIMPYSADVEVWNGLVPDFVKKDAKNIFEEYHYKTFVKKGISGFKLDECDNSDYNQSNWSYPDSVEFPSGLDGEQMHNAIGVLYQDVINQSFQKAKRRTYSQVRASGIMASPMPFVLYSDLYDHGQFIRGLSTSGFSGLLWCPEIRDCMDGKELLRRLETAIFSSQTLINSWRIPNPPWKQVNIEKNLLGEEMEDAQYYTEETRRLMNIRMQLIPYLYSAFLKYHFQGIPPIRSMVLEFPEDKKVRNIENQYFFGDSMIVCPLTSEEGTSRSVYLPTGNWYHFFTKEKYEGEKEYHVYADYNEIPVFVKEGAIIPLAKSKRYIDCKTVLDVEIHIFGNAEGNFLLYQDDDEKLCENEEKWPCIELKRKQNEKLDYKEHHGKCKRYKICDVIYW